MLSSFHAFIHLFLTPVLWGVNFNCTSFTGFEALSVCSSSVVRPRANVCTIQLQDPPLSYYILIPKSLCGSVQKLRNSLSFNPQLAHLSSFKKLKQTRETVYWVFRSQKQVGNGAKWKQSLLNDFKFGFRWQAFRKLIVVIFLVNTEPGSIKVLINVFW